jgi:hypothetical protein
MSIGDTVMSTIASTGVPAVVRRSIRRTAALVSLALVAGLLGPLLLAATPAYAALAGVVRASRSSADDSNNKSVTVSCPFGTKVLNAGGYIDGGNGSVLMDDIFPNEALTSVTVTGLETDQPMNTAWTVNAYATCAPEPAGLEWNWQQSATNATDKSVTVGCTGNRTLLGTGATIEGGAGNVVIDEIKPNGAYGDVSTSVTVWAYEDGVYNTPWNVNAYAICADPLAGQQTLWGVGAWNASDKGWSKQCDPGQAATGTGVEIGSFDEGEILIEAAYSDGSPTVAPTTAIVSALEEDPVANSWGIEAFVLCVDA